MIKECSSSDCIIGAPGMEHSCASMNDQWFQEMLCADPGTNLIGNRLEKCYGMLRLWLLLIMITHFTGVNPLPRTVFRFSLNFTVLCPNSTD